MTDLPLPDGDGPTLLHHLRLIVSLVARLHRGRGWVDLGDGDWVRGRESGGVQQFSATQTLVHGPGSHELHR